MKHNFEIQSFGSAVDVTDTYEGEPSLSELAAAHASGEIPSVWTPAHVGLRLVEAYETLRRTPSRIRPARFGTAWPQIVRDGSEFIDAERLAMAQATGSILTANSILEAADKETQAILREDADERLAKEAKQPTSEQTSRADEALGWCFVYLQHRPMQAAALQDWAFCQAYELSVAKFLRRRVVAVEAAMAAAERYENDRRNRQRRSDAREIAEWANQEMANGINPVAVKAAAEGMMATAALNAMPVKLRRKDVCPDKCFTERWMNLNRKNGAAELAAALNKAGVPVR
jgi:Tfp pilus assembly protein PilE